MGKIIHYDTQSTQHDWNTIGCQISYAQLSQQTSKLIKPKFNLSVNYNNELADWLWKFTSRCEWIILSEYRATPGAKYNHKVQF